MCYGNGLHVLGNGSHVGRIMSFGIMSHLGLCCSGLCRIQDYVVRDYVAFGIMSFGIMLHSGLCRSGLCRIWGYVVRDYVAQMG